ncbi:MAG: MBOAT family protein [Clostridia bacterium]|jgi:alginate O-acetyltransferase complex protein AlgI|nr:MBOAT family protein [Clostridia bacterium]
MVFSNLFFLYVFLPLLMLAYFILKNNAYRRGVLVAFSLLFYAWGEPVCVFLMIGLVAADYLFGRLIGSTRVQSRRKLWLTLAIVSNLGVLGFYKYLGFLTETVNAVFSVTIPVVSVSMPIGISFFTFQTMSYVIDVYREDADVQKSFFRLLLYVSFFPQLIAGPIVRYKDIEAQLESRAVPAAQFNDGLFRFAQGLAKKALIADSCATVINALYGLTDVTLLSRWAGAVFFTLQLYFDFSGYSDMAIGLGRMFGFRFLENFNYPLVSKNATEFWRRWHISLGTFFRDYVYIPLGGNRHDQQRNILVVWFLTGLWHGAAWNFILWGLYYAFLLMFEKKVLLGWFKKIPSLLASVIGHAYTVFITVFGFAIFYFDKGLFKNLGYLFGIGIASGTDLFTNSILLDNVLLLAAAVLFAVPVVPKLWSLVENKIPYSVGRILKTAVVVVLVGAATVRLVGNSYSPFLYFRF